MPLPIDIAVVEGTTFSDGLQTLTSKDTSHIRILSYDDEGFIKYEISPPRKITSKSLKEYIGEDRLIGTETTIVATDGTTLGQYKYFERVDSSIYVDIQGIEKEEPHRIELGRLIDRESPISRVARAIAYKFDTGKFSRKELMPFIPEHMRYSQKLKSLLGGLHYAGFLIKEIDPISKTKTKELYAATDKLKKLVVPSPEQA
jgi:hypothetical protein